MAGVDDILAKYSGGGGAPSDPVDSILSKYSAPAPPAEPDSMAPPQREGPGAIESALRGVKQGVTFGFGDEITGALESAFTDKTYKQARDEARANDQAARDAHGNYFTAGEIGGGIASSFIPGLGAAGAGARLGAVVARGAAQGALAGIGNSEADLTKGDVGGVAQDALISGALGGVTSGIASRVLKGAPERLEKRILGDITDGATATQRDRVVGAAGKKASEAVDLIRGDKAILRAADDPHKLVPAIEGALDSRMTRIDDIIQKKSAPILVSDVIGRVEDVAKRLAADPGKADVARAVASKADDVLEAWGNRSTVTAQEVRVLAKDIGDAAFAGSPAVAPKAGKKASAEVWGELKDLLSDSVKSGGGDVAELKKLNSQVSTLMNMRDAAVYRATRESTPSTRLSSRLSGALDIGLAFTHPQAFVAKKSYDLVGKPAMRAGDTALAQLEQAARRGSTGAQLAQMGVALGLGRETSDQLGQWLIKNFGGAQATDEP